MAERPVLEFRDRAEWRKWLKANHSRSSGIWAVIYRKDVDQEGLRYIAALEEALCFGWIDSQMRKRDPDSFVLQFTPRRPGSVWSARNKETALRMIREGRMTAKGLALIKDAKKSGAWKSAYSLNKGQRLPPDLSHALRKNGAAQRFFKSLSNSGKGMYIHWVLDAKREETRKARINEVVRRCRLGIGPAVRLPETQRPPRTDRH